MEFLEDTGACQTDEESWYCEAGKVIPGNCHRIWKSTLMNKSVWLTEKPEVFWDVWITAREQRNRRITEPKRSENNYISIVRSESSIQITLGVKKLFS